MKKKTSASILAITTKGSTHVGGSSPNGSRQPPRNIVTVIAEITTTFMYSAMKYEAKRPPPYSVLYPPTSSASASGRSKGGRLVSANPATPKVRKPTNCGTTYQTACCDCTIETSDSEPAIITTPISESPSATS